MAYAQGKKAANTNVADPRWKDLYMLGAAACVVFILLILVAVGAYFIWPYTPGVSSVESIFSTLQGNRVGGLISLDLFLVLGVLVSIPVGLALYAALKQVNEPYALFALVLILLSVALCLQSRPIAEVVYLSDQYAAATTDAARSQCLAAGQALLSHFNGTAWMLYTVLGGLANIVYSLLMLRSRIFSKWTAYAGLVLSVAGLGIFIPVIGVPLALVATLGGVLWFALIGRELLRAGRQIHAPQPAT